MYIDIASQDTNNDDDAQDVQKMEMDVSVQVCMNIYIYVQYIQNTANY